MLVVLKLEHVSKSLGSNRLPGSTPSVSGTVDLTWGLKICISNKFRVMVMPRGRAHTLRTTGLNE